MGVTIYPKYEDLFPQQNIPDLNELLEAISSRTVLKMISFLNAKLHLRQNDLKAQEHIFYTWIRKFDDDEAILNRYTLMKQEVVASGNQLILFTTFQLLQLQQHIIYNFNSISDLGESNRNDELNAFKIWLLFNSIGDDQVVETLEALDNDIEKFVVVNDAVHYEYKLRKDFGYQILLASSFFTYVAENPELQPYLAEFIATKHVHSHQEYLRHIVGSYAGVFTDASFGFRLEDATEQDRTFFDSFAYSLSTDPFSALTAPATVDNDFKVIRSYPLVKEENGQYYPLFYNFYVDKLYQGLIFDFYRLTSIKRRFRRFDNFLQHLGHYFAEQHLFYQFVEGCFTPKKEFVAVPGERYSDIEYSDYYVRDSNRLFLFEYKNSMVSAAVKQSGDYATIQEAVYKKLVESSTEAGSQAKGVGQLVKVIDRIRAGGFYFDPLTEQQLRNIQIYPIILHIDEFFSAAGIQLMVNEVFQDMLDTSSTHQPYVHDVILMHLKDIVDISFSITAGGMSLKDIVQQYSAIQRALKRFLPRTQSDAERKFFKERSDFRTVVSDLIPEFANREALLNKLALALDLSKPSES